MPTSLGPAEILVILIVALIVLGPKRLPEAGRSVGKALAEVRRWTTDVKSEIKSAIDIEAPGASTVVASETVSASSTAVDTQAVVPVAEVVEPVTVSGTATGVDTDAEQSVGKDPAPADHADPASKPDPEPESEPAMVAVEPEADVRAMSEQAVAAAEPAVASGPEPEPGVAASGPEPEPAVVPAEPEPEVVAAGPESVTPMEVTAVTPMEVTSPDVLARDDPPGDPTAELPESPSGDPARP